jgi:hypothetical protein
MVRNALTMHGGHVAYMHIYRESCKSSSAQTFTVGPNYAKVHASLPIFAERNAIKGRLKSNQTFANVKG